MRKAKMPRCSWCPLGNPLYVAYHDKEWGQLHLDEHYLYEMLILESFQAGLSWECVLNKRESFRQAFDHFDLDKIIDYDDMKITELLQNKNIIRHRLKIKSAISNSQIFRAIQNEFGSFSNYLRHFTGDKILYEVGLVSNDLSDVISRDLKKRGMKFVGTKIIYSYLQAIGLINSHESDCFLYAGN